MGHTIETLAAEPRWDLARVQMLPGRSRGDLLGSWGTNLTARFGADALARVRKRLPPPLDQLPSTLSARDWVPVHAQLVLTEAIVDELLGGDMRALYVPLVEDTRAGIGRIQLALLRSVGPGRAFQAAPRTFRKVHERGTVEVEVSGRRARTTFQGSPLFTHPTWRLMQLFATRMMLELADSPGSVAGEDGGSDGFVAVASW